MTLNNTTHTLQLIATNLRGSYHGILQSTSLHQISPFGFRVKSASSKVDVPNRSTSEIMQGLFRKASLNSLITSVYFGPGLLKQHHPEFSIGSVGKSRKIIHIRKIIVHIHSQPLPPIQQLNRVIINLVPLSKQKQIQNTLRLFSQSSQPCQKVTIS